MEQAQRKGLTRDLAITGVLIAMGLILPTIFHAFNMGGPVFLPMHIPVLLCGLLIGRKYGFWSGLITPLLSSILTGMPPLFPVAFTMSIELATYGYVSGLLKKKTNVYVALIGAQVVGRIVATLSNFVILGIVGKPFAFSTYLTGVFVTALPGILLQIILVPAAIIIIEKAGFNKHYE